MGCGSAKLGSNDFNKANEVKDSGAKKGKSLQNANHNTVSSTKSEDLVHAVPNSSNARYEGHSWHSEPSQKDLDEMSFILSQQQELNLDEKNLRRSLTPDLAQMLQNSTKKLPPLRRTTSDTNIKKSHQAQTLKVPTSRLNHLDLNSKNTAVLSGAKKVNGKELIDEHIIKEYETIKEKETKRDNEIISQELEYQESKSRPISPLEPKPGSPLPTGSLNSLRKDNPSSMPQLSNEKDPKASLFAAALRGEFQECVVLLSHVPILAKDDETGDTLLHKAVIGGNADVVRLFIERGVELEAPNALGLTPVLQANAASIVRLLIQYGANLAKVDQDGNSLLHLMVQQGNNELIELLLEKGVDVNQKNAKKETPLHHAVAFNHSNIVKLLLEKGANVENEDENGKKPADLTKESNIIEKLKIAAQST